LLLQLLYIMSMGGNPVHLAVAIAPAIPADHAQQQMIAQAHKLVNLDNAQIPHQHVDRVRHVQRVKHVPVMLV
jgi:hypothetical protein